MYIAQQNIVNELDWYLSFLKTCVAGNKFPLLKVVRNPKKFEQAWLTWIGLNGHVASEKRPQPADVFVG